MSEISTDQICARINKDPSDLKAMKQWHAYTSDPYIKSYTKCVNILIDKYEGLHTLKGSFILFVEELKKFVRGGRNP